MDAAPSIAYYDSDSVSIQPVSTWTGARAASTPGQSLLTGTSNATGVLYIGPISGSGGNAYSVKYPGATETYVHSTMGDLAVGNGGDGPAHTDHALI